VVSGRLSCDVESPQSTSHLREAGGVMQNSALVSGPDVLPADASNLGHPARGSGGDLGVRG
jgi:hypothetical protein